jgi:hypothetical protein
MTDRLFRCLPWAHGLPLVLTLIQAPVLPFDELVRAPGMREILVFWVAPSLIAFVHIALNRSLSDADRRSWRRSLVVGGWAVGLIYLCSSDRSLPPNAASTA